MFHFHIWQQNEIIGQLEFRGYSQIECYGYVHLFYLIKKIRGKGCSHLLNKYVLTKLKEMGCKGALLSVSKENSRAKQYYKKNGCSGIVKLAA